VRFRLPKRSIAVAVVALAAAPGQALAADGRVELVGALHEHSGYSDGWPTSRPADFFAAGKAEGLDFMGSSDHSDNVDLPYTLSTYCLKDFNACLEADKVNPFDSYRKWPATLEQANAATTPSFTAFRGFEWTSDVYGHINVFFSKKVSNAKLDGKTPEFLWRWLLTAPESGGGSDGIATFNHPGAKGTGSPSNANWYGFAYRSAIDRQMVGIEVFNDQTDYGSVPSKGSPPPEGWYARALDRGWHLGAIGAEDLGHNREDNWGGPNRAKTVISATGRSNAEIKSAMLERRFYAIKRVGIRMSYTLDGHAMGSRFDASPGSPLRVEAGVTAPSEGTNLKLDLITSGGQVVATGDSTLSIDILPSAERRYYYVRVRKGSGPGEPIAYSSPIWTTTSLLPDTSPAEPLSPTAPRNTISIDGDSSTRLDANGRMTVPLLCSGLSTRNCRTAISVKAVIARRNTVIGNASIREFPPGFAARIGILLTAKARAELATKGRLNATVTIAGSTRAIRILPAR
jgi:hypothetical protein